MQTAQYVDTSQQTAMIEITAGVWSRSLNTVYHNETLTGRQCCSPSLRSDDPLGFLNTSQSEHCSTCVDFWGLTCILPGGNYKAALGVFTQFVRTMGDKGMMPTFCGCNSTKTTTTTITNLYFGCQAVSRLKTYCWPISVGHYLLGTHYFREREREHESKRFSAKAGHTKMELQKPVCETNSERCGSSNPKHLCSAPLQL